jgi:phosphate/sulfate permease
LPASTLQVSDRLPPRGGVADLPNPIRRRLSGAPIAALQSELAEARALLAGKTGLRVIPKEQRWQVRTDLLKADAALAELERSGALPLSAADRALLAHARAQLRGATDYSPFWVLLFVGFSLGLGTMIGWKRIVVTVGEKIGKTHLSYGQGAAAEVVAMATIGMADFLGMPVSTTHVLSSGVAGTMTANRSGLQTRTLGEIALAWVLTLPISMLLAGGLFALFRGFLG